MPREMEGAVIDPSPVQRAARMIATRRYSQREIAAATGVSRATIGRIVRGERRVELVPDPDAEPLADYSRTLTPGQFARYRRVLARKLREGDRAA
jgi:transcriptional regulator with XRE-family HTH domain